MRKHPKIVFIGAGSTVFMRNIICDILQTPALAGADLALMDIDQERLTESQDIVTKIVEALQVPATVSCHTHQRDALDGADFVVVAFQIGGYEPCTVSDFEIPKQFGLRQTIADTLGIGGIMRGLRTVPHIWSICEDMQDLCPQALLLNYVNPMAMITWAISEKFPDIKQVGLCHSVQWTLKEIAHDLDIQHEDIAFECVGINHIAFMTKLAQRMPNGTQKDLYPALRQAYREGLIPKPNPMHLRCPNKVRYEIMQRFGYFVTESSEHFSEYVPWFIKNGRDDLIEQFGIPLDEYPKRCVEQVEDWKQQRLKGTDDLLREKSHEFAAILMNAIWTNTPTVIHGNVPNHGLIDNLPQGCAVEVACLIDENGVQPTRYGKLEPQLAAIMQLSVTVQGLVVEALVNENPRLIYHAAAMDPHTGAELSLQEIWDMVDALLEAHDAWVPEWARRRQALQADVA